MALPLQHFALAADINLKSLYLLLVTNISKDCNVHVVGLWTTQIHRNRSDTVFSLDIGYRYTPFSFRDIFKRNLYD